MAIPQYGRSETSGRPSGWWPADQDLVEAAAELTRKHDLRSLDALHLAAALLLQDRDLVLATWDCRLHAAGREEAIAVVPERLE